MIDRGSSSAPMPVVNSSHTNPVSVCARRAGSIPSATEYKSMTERNHNQDHAAPPRRRVVDIHAHWYPADWLKVFERDGSAEGATLERKASGYTIRTERIVNAFDEEFVDLGLRLDGMSRQRVDV